MCVCVEVEAPELVGVVDRPGAWLLSVRMAVNLDVLWTNYRKGS